MPLFYSFASTARQSARSALIELGCRMSADPAEAEGAEGSNASAASALHSRRYGACSAEAAASEAFGLSERGRLHSRIASRMPRLSTVPRSACVIIRMRPYAYRVRATVRLLYSPRLV